MKSCESTCATGSENKFATSDLCDRSNNRNCSMTYSFLIATIFSLLLSGGAGGCRANQAKSQNNNRPDSKQEKEQPVIDEKAANDLKVVAEGFHSAIETPFIAVIRDAAAYSELVKLDHSLPKLDTNSKNNILIAAFLGGRNTGGYSVEISRTEHGEIQIHEKKPGKDVMVPQMITSPFKVVSIAAGPATPVRIDFDSAWASSISSYTITKGTFAFSGGFAGRREEFELEGGVGLMKLGRLVSFRFTLRKKGESEKPMLADFATGTIESDEIKISVLSAGDSIPPPTNGLNATGKLTNHGQNLSLTFISLPTMIADGFGGGGMIEAVKVIPTDYIATMHYIAPSSLTVSPT